MKYGHCREVLLLFVRFYDPAIFIYSCLRERKLIQPKINMLTICAVADIFTAIPKTHRFYFRRTNFFVACKLKIARESMGLVRASKKSRTRKAVCSLKNFFRVSFSSDIRQFWCLFQHETQISSSINKHLPNEPQGRELDEISNEYVACRVKRCKSENFLRQQPKGRIEN